MARRTTQPAEPAEEVRQLADAVLAEELYWFPVRHHSPAVARHVESAILARRPKVVFIEGPHEANALIPHLLDQRTEPPVAVYSSFRDDNNVLGLAGVVTAAADIPPRFAAWYPLVAYSPEYRAMAAAQQVGAEVVFIDLPHYALIPPAGPTTPAKESRGGKGVEQEDDRLIVESGFYQALAKAGGYRTWQEAWDCLFEVRPFADTEELRRELAVFCAAARRTSDPQRLIRDGTLPRERFMWRVIQDTLRSKNLSPDEAMVVCGGFHLFLRKDDPEPPPPLPPGTVYTTVTPYSFFRLSELSGYGAGNRAPAFYQLVWDLHKAGRAEDVVMEHVIAVLSQGRREGEPLSSADAIAATHHAGMLSRLRGRAAPTLDDIHDALVTCCCKGDPAEEGRALFRALDQAGIGTRIGKVTPGVGRLPVVNDFYNQLSDLDLGEFLRAEKGVRLVVDKREPPGARRSAFLHRLLFLGVPFAALKDASADGSLFKETWAAAWSPRVDDALVELNLYGDSVEAAATAKLREALAEEAGHAGRTCQRLLEAVNMDLPDLVSHAEEVCGRAIDTDDRFVSLSLALSHLAVLERFAAHRGFRRDTLEDLIARCFDRACFALGHAISVPDDQQAGVVTALQGVVEMVLRGGDKLGLDRGLFVEQVRRASEESPVPFLRGAFLGTLAELRELTASDLAAEVSSLARGLTEEMLTAGDLIDGILAVSRTSILLGADALIVAIDELLRAAAWEPFLTMLPRLRAAFERLHERDRDSLAHRVALRYGLAEVEEVRDLRTSVAAAARIARIDQEVARVMENWSF